METVAYIIERKDNKGFKPFIANLVPDDDDSALYIIGEVPAKETLEEAQDFVKNSCANTIKIFLNPIPPSSTGISWLSDLKETNPGEQKYGNMDPNDIDKEIS